MIYKLIAWMGAASLAVFTVILAAGLWVTLVHSEEYPTTNRRFVSSGYVDGSYYLILDRHHGCKYLAYGTGNSFAMTPLIAADRRPDCSGPKDPP